MMFTYLKRQKNRFLYVAITRMTVCTLSLSLGLGSSAVQAQSVLNLPIPGTMVSPSTAFVPVLLKGMTIHPDDPLKFDFIIDSGNTDFTPNEIKQESEKLVKYFLASMTVPKDDLWVNLSPYEKNRIIPEQLGRTELGRDMLAQDYILKQLTASLMYPEKELGKRFWDKVYKKAQEEFGTSEIPVNTFNKVWILPEIATVYEHHEPRRVHGPEPDPRTTRFRSGSGGVVQGEHTVYITDTYLKVMLDSDYQAMNEGLGSELTPKPQTQTPELSEQIIREIIIPEIEREVNKGAHFAPLRQIYHSLILAKWYKETIKNSLLSQVYADKNLISGVESGDETLKDQIYAQYMKAYKKGVFNFIKEDYDQLSQETIPRKYFSGGEKLTDVPLSVTSSPVIGSGFEGSGYEATVAVIPQKSSDSSIAAVDALLPVTSMASTLTKQAASSSPINNFHKFTEAEREALIVERMPQVKYIAQRIAVKLPPDVQLDDLISTGVIGLLDAVEKFDENKGVQFKTYAEIRIRGAILDSLRDLDWASRSLRKKQKDIDATRHLLRNRLGREPTDGDIAKEMGMELTVLQSFLQSLQQQLHTLNLEDSPIEENVVDHDDEQTISHVPVSEGESPFDIAVKNEQRALAAKFIKELPEREQQILSLYHGKDLTMKEIGKILGVNESRISQLRTRAIKRLQEKVRLRELAVQRRSAAIAQQAARPKIEQQVRTKQETAQRVGDEGPSGVSTLADNGDGGGENSGTDQTTGDLAQQTTAIDILFEEVHKGEQLLTQKDYLGALMVFQAFVGTIHELLKDANTMPFSLRAKTQVYSNRADILIKELIASLDDVLRQQAAQNSTYEYLLGLRNQAYQLYLKSELVKGLMILNEGHSSETTGDVSSSPIKDEETEPGSSKAPMASSPVDASAGYQHIPFAKAKEYAQNNTAIQKAPEFSEFNQFIAWYKRQTAQSLPSGNEDGKKIGAAYAVQALGHAGKIKGSVENFNMDAAAYEYAQDNTAIGKAPKFSEFDQFITWYKRQTARNLPNRSKDRKKRGKKIGASYTVRILSHVSKITGSLEEFERNAGAYEYAQDIKAIEEAPEFSKFNQFITWYKRQTAQSLPNRNKDRKRRGKKIGASYAVQVLSYADKITGSVVAFQSNAMAYEYAQDNTAMQEAPTFSQFDQFIRWYNRQTAQSLPSGNEDGKKIGASYAVQALGYAGKTGKIKGSVPDFQRNAGAYEYAQNNTAIQEASEFSEFDQFIAWFNRQTAQSLPNLSEEGEKISASYAVLILSHAGSYSGKIKGSVEAFQRNAGAYERAVKEKEVISDEIRRIWSQPTTGRSYRTDSVRLNVEFDPIKLLNLNVKTEKRPVSQRYRRMILKHAYEIYGRNLIAQLEARSSSSIPLGTIPPEAGASSPVNSKTRLVKWRDRSGFGLAGGRLTDSETQYREWLEPHIQDHGLSIEQEERIINVLVRIKEGSLRLRGEFFSELDMENILNYRAFDVEGFMKRMGRERIKYERFKDQKGRKGFSPKKIEKLLYKKMIPLSWIQELMADDLTKFEATIVVLNWGNPQEKWKELRPIRDELIKDGKLSKTEATRIVLSWSNPQEKWEELRPIRDELVKDGGLLKTNATTIVLGWSDPKKKWEELKPIRDEMVKDGNLSKPDATTMVLKWSNPKKRWEELRPKRDRLMREKGYSLSRATRTILDYTIPIEGSGDQANRKHSRTKGKYNEFDLRTTVDYIEALFKEDPERNTLPPQEELSVALGPSQITFSRHFQEILTALKERITQEGYDEGLKERIEEAIAKKVGNRPASSPVISNNNQRTTNSKLGGIDMNEINVDRQGGRVDIQFDPIELQEIIDAGITGFTPVIINLTPLPSVLPLLGLEPRKEEDFDLSSLN